MAVRLGWRPGSVCFVLGCAAVAGTVFLIPLWGPIQNSLILGLGGALVVASLDSGAPGWIRKFLSSRLLVSLGIWSYGIYLWHVPLLTVPRYPVALGWPRVTVAILLTVCVSAASHRWVETPIRDAVRARTSDREPQSAVTPALVRSGQAG